MLLSDADIDRIIDAIIEKIEVKTGKVMVERSPAMIGMTVEYKTKVTLVRKEK